MKIFTVDAFTHTRFAGNPAAVCLLDHDRDDDWMQQVAGEMNLSETAFVGPLGEVTALRWFTPKVEVDLCGHATLAAAHVLWSEGAGAETLRFSTRSGELRATRNGAAITLDLPAIVTTPIDAPEGLVAALGIGPVTVGRCRDDWLVEVSDWRAVAALSPDTGRLGALPVRGVIVTAEGGERADFTSRFFAPAAGVPEDPVTGVAHCALGPYWAARLGRRHLIGYQASRRGGFVEVEVGDGRVDISGEAVTVLSGTID